MNKKKTSDNLEISAETVWKNITDEEREEIIHNFLRNHPQSTFHIEDNNNKSIDETNEFKQNESSSFFEIENEPMDSLIQSKAQDTSYSNHHNTIDNRKSNRRFKIVIKIIICIGSLILAFCSGGWIKPFIYILPFFGVLAYEHAKFEKANEVHDDPSLYNYGTKSHD